MSHLFVAVSGHGYGHLSQISPLVNALAARYPGLRISLQSDLPQAFVSSRLSRIDTWYQDIADAGMVMRNALDVDEHASLKAYAELGARQSDALQQQLQLWQQDRPDLLIADIPHLPLLAAQQAGVPNIAVCSLNWADVLEAYCGDLAGAVPIIDQLRNIYSAADLFIRTEPALPMSWLPNAADVGPLVNIGTNRRDQLVQRPGLASSTSTDASRSLKDRPRSL